MRTTFFLTLLVVLGAVGCIQGPSRPPSTSFLADRIRDRLEKRDANIADLAHLCAEAEQKKQNSEEIKTKWNDTYKIIVKESADDLGKLVRESMSSATTSEERAIIWKAIQKGFEP